MSKQRLLELANLVESNGLPFTAESLRELADEWGAMEAKITELTRLNAMLSLDGKGCAEALMESWRKIEKLEADLRECKLQLEVRGKGEPCTYWVDPTIKQ